MSASPALRWRELHSLCELSADLAARGCLRQRPWFRFALQLVSACLSALKAAASAYSLHGGDGGGGGGTTLSGVSSRLCAWTLQAIGTLAVAAPAIIQHIDASGGFRTLAELALASAAHCKPPPLPTSGDATAAAGDFAQRHAPPEPWEGALWLLGELTALGTRSGRETSGVKELAGLLRACSADALAVFGGHVAAAGAANGGGGAAAATATADAIADCFVVPLPEPLRRALANHLPPTAPPDVGRAPGAARLASSSVPAHAQAAVVRTVAQVLDTSRARARKGLPTVRRQLTDAGVLPLIILMALRRPCAEAAEAHGAAEAAVEAAEEVVAAKEEETVAAADDGGVLLTRSPGGGNAPYHCLTTAAAFRALLEITSDDDAAKRATFDLLGPPGCSACSVPSRPPRAPT